MKADALEANLPHQLNHAGTQTIGRIVGAVGLAEDQIVIFVVRAEEFAVALLFLTVSTQHLECPLGNGEAPGFL